MSVGIGDTHHLLLYVVHVKQDIGQGPLVDLSHTSDDRFSLLSLAFRQQPADRFLNKSIDERDILATSSNCSGS